MKKRILIAWARWSPVGQSAFKVDKNRLASWVNSETKTFVKWAKPKIIKAGFEFDKDLYSTVVTKVGRGYQLSFKITFINDDAVTSQEFDKMIRNTGLLKLGKFVN